MSLDPLSDIIRMARAESLMTGGFTAGGRWAIRFPAPDKIKFFAVAKGSCWVRIDGDDEPLRIETGDVGLLCAKRSFVVASDPDVTPVDAMSLFACTRTAQVGNGEEFAYIGGHVLLDPASGRLLADVLPPWIHVRAALPQAATFRALLELLLDERDEHIPGTQLAAQQLAQLLFIQILRVHLKTAGPTPPGWLRALSDTRVAPAIRLMHEKPGFSWKLDDLAKACAMSRTTFAAHFKAAAGVAPLAYLTEWRMRMAEHGLRENNTPVAVVAQELGYNSESSFSHAFKRVTGRSPKTYRNAARTSASAANN